MSELPAQERIILAIDTSDIDEAERLASIAYDLGARFVKLGLELSSATSWNYCSDLAASYELDWVADAKLHDIPNTTAAAVKNIKKLDHPPFGITMHTTSGHESMKAAQEEAGVIKMLGVTVLTSISKEEAAELYRQQLDMKVPELAEDAVRAGLQGIVCSPLEIGAIKSKPETANLFAMVPGVRSHGASSNDQSRVSTPGDAIRAGADLLVIGRQITKADDPSRAYKEIVKEIEAAI